MVSQLALIELLADGRFHSGESLGQRLGLSRSAVWKRVRALESLGLECHAVRGKGYRLVRPLELWNREAILAWLSPAAHRLLSELELLGRVDSTNTYLMRRARMLESGHACFAEWQEAGKGRRGRSWISPFGRNLYLSLHWRFSLPAMALAALPLALGGELAHMLARAGVPEVGLKWPNDLLWNGRKLGGILLEMEGEAGGPCHVVAGIGLNIDMGSLSEGAVPPQPWSDLRQAMGDALPSRNAIGGRVLSVLLEAMARYRREGFAPFRERWERYDICCGKAVRLFSPSGVIEGVAQGVDEYGALRLRREGGESLHHSGEVSLRLAGAKEPCS